MWEGSGLGPADVDIFNPYDGYLTFTQQFLEGFQWHGVKWGEAHDFYADDIRVEGPHPFLSSGGNNGTGRNRAVLYADSIQQLARHRRRAAGYGASRDRPSGLQHARQQRLHDVQQAPKLGFAATG